MFPQILSAPFGCILELNCHRYFLLGSFRHSLGPLPGALPNCRRRRRSILLLLLFCRSQRRGKSKVEKSSFFVLPSPRFSLQRRRKTESFRHSENLANPFFLFFFFPAIPVPRSGRHFKLSRQLNRSLEFHARSTLSFPLALSSFLE